MKKLLTPLALSLLIIGLTPSYSNPQSQHHVLKKHLKHHRHVGNRCGCMKRPGLRRADPEGETSDYIEGPSDLPESGTAYFPYDFNVPGQSFVTTGPFIGTSLEFSGSNLIINNPSVNQDIALLDVRKNIIKRLRKLGLCPEAERSHLLLSGVVEAQAGYIRRENGKTGSDIDLTTVGIDAYILGPSTWTSALISLDYDNANGVETGSFNNNSRVLNSRVFVNKAFIVVGDFTQSPFYSSFGQMYVPFGVYSSAMVSSPLTRRLARTKARAIVVGFDDQCPNGFLASAFAFRGDSYAGAKNHINNGGVNLAYHFDGKDFCGKNISGKIGGSFITNLADSVGMQVTGNGAFIVSGTIIPTAFGGFGGDDFTGSEKLDHRVPAYSVYTSLSVGKQWDFLAEYIPAIRSFSTTDLTMNDHGAKPQALNAEAAYTFQGTCKPVSLSVGYGMTKDALALGLPAKRYVATVNTSLWKSTLESLEFRHDVNYSSSSTSSGSGVPGPDGRGGADNSVIVQFDIYF